VKLFHRPLPMNWLVRELPGFAFLAFYMGVLPLLLGRTVFRRFYEKMGPLRYFVGANLFLIMMLVPVKMYLRWAFNLKYILYLQEFSFNI
jgi:hypothetical protein